MIQPITGGGAVYAGGVFDLKAGDIISLDAIQTITIYMASYHSYFGAYLIWVSFATFVISAVKDTGPNPHAMIQMPLIWKRYFDFT